MSLAILSLSVLVVLSTFVVDNVEGQPKDCSTGFPALKELIKAVAGRLEAKIQLQTTIEANPTIIALDGDDVEMPCIVHGIPLPEITWTRDNATLESDRVMVENNGKTLRIKKVQLSDEGTYICVTANGVPGTPATQSFRLIVLGEVEQCSRIVESDSGNLPIKSRSTACLWVIKLQNTTGFRLELDRFMTEPIWVIPEQSPFNSNNQSYQLNGFQNPSYVYEGQILAIVVPPGRERTTLSWTGLALDVSRVSLSTKLVKDVEGMLEWESKGEGIDNVFWVFDHKITQELNWTLNAAFGTRNQENPCESMYFSVLQIQPDGNVSEILRTCDNSTMGSVTSEINSQVFVRLQLKSVDVTRSKLRVLWTHRENDEPLKRNVDGIVAGTHWGVFVIPFNSAQIKAVPSGHISGLTFDWNSRRIYYLKKGAGILRSNLDGSESNTLVSDPSSSLVGLTIEPTTGNIYYGNVTSRTIRVCNNDATKCSTVFKNRKLAFVYDIAIHRSKGLLFWSIKNQIIVRANLDGSNATNFVRRMVRGLSVDENEDRIYWGLQLFKREIESSDLNGKDIRKLPIFNAAAHDVAIDNDRVYFSFKYSKTIYGISKSGTDQTLVAKLPDLINHIALFGTQVSNQPWNPCKQSQCAHLCVLVTRWSYRCTCPDEKKLQVDGQRCTL